MSSLVFPIMPIIDREAGRTPAYETTRRRAPSGRETSWSWRNAPIIDLQFRLTLRTWKASPAPFAAYDELALLKYFHDTHLGSWDSFLLDNSTGAYDASGVVQPRVKFVEDHLPLRRLQPGVWIVDMKLATVIP